MHDHWPGATANGHRVILQCKATSQVYVNLQRLAGVIPEGIAKGAPGQQSAMLGNVHLSTHEKWLGSFVIACPVARCNSQQLLTRYIRQCLVNGQGHPSMHDRWPDAVISNASPSTSLLDKFISGDLAIFMARILVCGNWASLF